MFGHYNHQMVQNLFLLLNVGMWGIVTCFYYLFLLRLIMCLFPPFFCSLGPHFKQGISRDKSSEVASEEHTNDSILSKDPEGGLLLPEQSLSNTFSFPVLNPCLADFVLKAVCYLHA